MRARSRARIRFVLVVFLLLGLIIQTAYASIWDVDSDNNFGRANVNLIISVRSSRAIGRSDPGDADDDWGARDLDPCICPTGWTQGLLKISNGLNPNPDCGQALPTRKTLTRNGSTFDKPDGDSLSFLRSFVSLPATSIKPLQNPARATSAFAFEPLSTYLVDIDEFGELRAAAIFGGSSRVIRSPGVGPRCKPVEELRRRYCGKHTLWESVQNVTGVSDEH